MSGLRQASGVLRGSGKDPGVTLKTPTTTEPGVRISGVPVVQERQQEATAKAAFLNTPVSVEIVDKFVGGFDQLTEEQKQFFEPIRTKPQGFTFKGTSLTYTDLLNRWIGSHPNRYKNKNVSQLDKLVLMDLIQESNQPLNVPLTGDRTPEEVAKDFSDRTLEGGGIGVLQKTIDAKRAFKRNSLVVNAVVSRVERNRTIALRSYAMADILFGFKKHKDFPTRITEGSPSQKSVQAGIEVAEAGAGAVEAGAALAGAAAGGGQVSESGGGEGLEASIQESLAGGEGRDSSALDLRSPNQIKLDKEANKSLKSRLFKFLTGAASRAVAAALPQGPTGEEQRQFALEQERIRNAPLVLGVTDLWAMSLMQGSVEQLGTRLRPDPFAYTTFGTTLDRPQELGIAGPGQKFLPEPEDLRGDKKKPKREEEEEEEDPTRARDRERAARWTREAAIFSNSSSSTESTLRNIGNSASNPASPGAASSMNDTFRAAGDSRFNAHGDGLTKTKKQNKGAGGFKKAALAVGLAGAMLQGGIDNVDVSGVNSVTIDTPDIIESVGTFQDIQPLEEEGEREEMKFDPITGEPVLPPAEQAQIQRAIQGLLGTAAAVASIGIQREGPKPKSKTRPPKRPRPGEEEGPATKRPRVGDPGQPGQPGQQIDPTTGQPLGQGFQQPIQPGPTPGIIVQPVPGQPTQQIDPTTGQPLGQGFEQGFQPFIITPTGIVPASNIGTGVGVGVGAQPGTAVGTGVGVGVGVQPTTSIGTGVGVQPASSTATGVGVGFGLRPGEPAGDPAGDPDQDFPQDLPDPRFDPPPKIPFPNIPCLDLIALFILHKISAKSLRDRALLDKQGKLGNFARFFNFVDKFFGGRNWGKEFSRCSISTVFVDDVTTRAITIIRGIGQGTPVPVSPVSGTNPPVDTDIPVGSPLPTTPGTENIIPETPAEPLTELQMLDLCIREKPRGIEFLLSVSSLKNTPATLKVSYLRAFCGL